MSSDMLREVSESLFEYLIEAFPTTQSYTRNDIEQDPMPPLLAHFLGQTLQHRLDVEVEHLRTVRSSWFDYEHPDVQHAYKSFVAALAQYSHIPEEEWRSTLKRATKLVIAHLILPTHTLVEFVFREEDGPLVAPIIYREISYFAAYPYLREAVETFLKKRQLKEIDRTRFSSLLTQVDRHMTANYSVDQWMRMLRPLFDLMRRVPQTRNQGVPIDMLSMFFGDKESYEIQGRLQVEKEVHRISTINEDALRRVLEGSVGPFEQELKTTPAPEPAASEPSHAAEPVAPTPSYLPAEDAPRKEEIAAPAPESDAKDKSKPLWERFQKAPAQKEKPAPKAETPINEPQDADDSVPLWMRFQKSGETSVSSAAAAAAKPVEQQPVEQQPGKPAPDSTAPAAKDNTPDRPAAEPAPATMDSQAPAPSHADEPHHTAPKPNPAASYANNYAPPPSSPYAAQDVPSVFGEAASYDEPLLDRSPLEQLEQAVLGELGANNRDMFIGHLFGGSQDEYERLLKRLNDLGTWEEASQLIAIEVFKRYQVNIYSPAAIMFTESIEDQFRQG